MASGELRRGPRRGRVAVVGAVLGMVGAGLALAFGGASGAAAATVTQQCAVSGAATPTGTPLVSGPMKTALTGTTLSFPVEAAVAVDQQIRPGGTVTTVATLSFDLGAKAHDVLVDQVHPAIAAAGYPQLVATSWVVLTLESSTLRLSLPAGVAKVGQPVAASPTVGSAAAWDGDGVKVTLGTLAADTRLGSGQSTSVTVGWKEADSGAAAPRTLALLPPKLAFTTWIDVGLSFAGSPLVGGVKAGWACDPTDAATPLASTVVDDGVPPSTTPITLPQAGPPPVISPPTTAPAQLWPAGATAPSGCAVSGFDQYGGWTGRTLAATGAFRTEQIDGGWWLVDPLGHPFFSQGVNHITYDGTPDRNGVAAYHDAVAAKYGSAEGFALAQVERFADWGYNTAGGWSDAEVQARMPYVLLVNLTSQNSGTGVMQDLFDPAWAAGVAATAAAVAADHADDPNLVGYWTDNELHWGPDWRPGHLFDDYLHRAAGTPGKDHLLAWLQDRYPTFGAFAVDFTTSAASWADLAGSASVASWTSTGGQATRDAWVGEVAERYFSVTVGSLRAADPAHLQFGPRMIAQTAGTPLLEAAGRWVDVASFNDYAIDPALLPGLSNADPTYLPVDHALAAQAAVVGKPILISEWGFRAADSGLPNTWPPLFPTLQTQGQRAGAYQQFVQSLLDTPYVVGQHFFEHADEPAAGRFDGEDSNFGLVDKDDEPYAELVQVSRWMHDCAYARLADAPATPSTTTSAPELPSGTEPTQPSGAPGAQPLPGSASYTG